jgi:tetratricopeptide (TPR) repeat protein
MSRNQEAMRCAQIALKLNPRYGKTHFLKAQVYGKQGDTRAAEEELKKCLESNMPVDLCKQAQEQLDELLSKKTE